MLSPLVVLLVALAGATPSVASAAPNRLPETCGVLPAPRMRARLTVTVEGPGIDPAPIREAATRVWRPEGISIEWLDGAGAAADPWHGIDFWIVASESLVAPLQRNAIGAVRMVGDSPQRLIRLSIEAARAWVMRELSGQLKVRAGAPFWLLRVGDGAERLRTTLAAAAAHEIGHFVLASKGHPDTGLMRADFERTADFTQPGDLQLDPRSRAQLAERLAAGAACR